MTWRATALGLVMVALAACGVTSDLADGPVSTTTASTAPDSGSGSTTPGTTGPGTTEPVQSGPDGGTRFLDSSGVYQLSVRKTWPHQSGSIEFWFVAAAKDGFRPNLNVLTQKVGSTTIAEYLDGSVSGITSQTDGKIVGSEEITLAHGDRGGLLEYTATVSGRHLHFLAIVLMTRGTAVLATLTAPDDSFDAIRRDVEPFMRTLQPAP